MLVHVIACKMLVKLFVGGCISNCSRLNHKSSHAQSNSYGGVDGQSMARRVLANLSSHPSFTLAVFLVFAAQVSSSSKVDLRSWLCSSRIQKGISEASQQKSPSEMLSQKFNKELWHWHTTRAVLLCWLVDLLCSRQGISSIMSFFRQNADCLHHILRQRRTRAGQFPAALFLTQHTGRLTCIQPAACHRRDRCSRSGQARPSRQHGGHPDGLRGLESFCQRAAGASDGTQTEVRQTRPLTRLYTRFRRIWFETCELDQQTG